MDKNVMIRVKVKQVDQKNNIEKIEFMTDARFYQKDNTYYIVYEESEITGMEGTKTTIKISGETVNIIRFGAVSSNIKFQQGKKYSCDYSTPYGVLDMTINPSQIKINVNENGGILYLEYEVEINGERIGMNSFEFFIK